IEPKKVAQRLVRLARYSGFEGIFFHADMHPANIFVLPDNKIVLIDFGSCGAFTKEDGNKWHEIFSAQARGDVGGMAKAAVSLIEPLPPIDVEEFRKKVEELFWKELYAFRSKHSAWWERTTAHLWIGYLRLTREYDMAININTLRMIRVTLLVDTVAGRLYPKTDHYREYQKYAREAGRRAKKRLFKRFRNLFQYQTFIRIEQAVETGINLAYRIEHFAESLPFRFSLLISKAAYAGMQIIRGLFVGTFITGSAVLAIVGYRRFISGPAIKPTAAFSLLLGNGWYESLLLIIALSVIRRVLYRMQQKNVERRDQ
ncbi:MAG TPA: AarF/UbiB family protein, partial [Thermoanaerobaculia bacterium]|nr:AarF/UbiB family protein [Thermoanaerobaculia bacterium]